MTRSPVFTQPPLLPGAANQTTCMLCGQPGATIPHDRALGYDFELSGARRPVVAFGWRHETCEPVLTNAPRT